MKKIIYLTSMFKSFTFLFSRYFKYEYFFTGLFKIKLGKRVYIGKRSILSLYSGGEIFINKHTSIEMYCKIATCGGNICIGSYCGIGNFCVLQANGGITIGDHVIFADGVKVIASNHNYEDIDIPISLQGSSSKGIVIGSGCWIGINSIILDGVELGQNVVVAAGSVVTKNFDSYCVIAGNPARIIKKYNLENKTWI